MYLRTKFFDSLVHLNISTCTSHGLSDFNVSKHRILQKWKVLVFKEYLKLNRSGQRSNFGDARVLVPNKTSKYDFLSHSAFIHLQGILIASPVLHVYDILKERNISMEAIGCNMELQKQLLYHNRFIDQRRYSSLQSFG